MIWFQFTVECQFTVNLEYQFTAKVANWVPTFANISCLILVHLFFSIYVDDMSQVVESNLYIYADDTCLLLKRKRPQLYLWLVCWQKLSIQSGEDMTKSPLFSSGYLKLVEKLDIGIKIK